MNNAKPWYASKTILFNALAAITTAILSQSAELTPVLGPSAIAFVSVGNIILRTLTNQPIAASKES